MDVALASIQHAMRMDTEWVRVIAENITHAQAVGYQRQIGIQSADFAAQTNTSLHTVVDSTPGTLVQTHAPLDIAFSGPGGMLVETPTGVQLSRGGHLHVDAQGQLLTPQGVVLGAAGPLTLPQTALDHAAIHITTDGAVQVAGQTVGQLQLRADSADSTQGLPRVQQGFIEQSNVQPIHEMLQLMELMRHFELTQKAIRSYDDLQQQAITQLGRL